MVRLTSHPAESQLALHARGDLSIVGAFRTERHLRRCEYCRREVESFRESSGFLRAESDELPAGLDWRRLSAEINANIHLGLEAGECVTPVLPAPDRMGWRAAAVMAGMMLLLLAAWWLNPPERRQHAMRAAHAEIRTTMSGIELNENGNALTLMHTRGRQEPIFVSAPGTLRARFVDAETGQVTINNVYTD